MRGAGGKAWALALAALLGWSAAGLRARERSLPRYSARQILAQMLKAQARQAVFSCDMEKSEYSDDSDTPDRRFTGTLRVKRGGKARYEVAEPSPQLLICDGRTLYMVLPQAKQVMEQGEAQMKTSGQFFLDLASSIRYYSKAGLARLVPVGPEFKGRDVEALQLTPRDPDSAGFDRAVFWVDLRRWVVLKAELLSGASRIEVRFTDIRAYTMEEVKKDPRKDLPDALFRYHVPDGYEVFNSLLP